MHKTPTRDWAQLPSELLQEIAGSLSEITDHIRFSSVCIPWQSALESTNFPRRRQFPWILQGPDPTNPSSHCNFRSLVENNRVYTLPSLNASQTKQTFTSSHGFLIDIDHAAKSNSLFNPLTGSRISLPQFTQNNIRCHKGRLIRSGPDKETLRVMVVLASSPISLQSDDDEVILSCVPGDESWKEVYKLNGHFPACCACTYYNGNFLALELWTKKTVVIDAITLEKVSEISTDISTQEDVFHFFVETPTGELLMVVTDEYYWGEEDLGIEPGTVDVYQLDAKMEWIKIRKLGDWVLFVDCYEAMCFNAGDFDGCRRNCIYYASHLANCINGESCCMVVCYDVESGGVEQIPGYWKNFANFQYPPAAWFVPTL